MIRHQYSYWIDVASVDDLDGCQAAAILCHARDRLAEPLKDLGIVQDEEGFARAEDGCFHASFSVDPGVGTIEYTDDVEKIVASIAESFPHLAFYLLAQDEEDHACAASIAWYGGRRANDLASVREPMGMPDLLRAMGCPAYAPAPGGNGIQVFLRAAAGGKEGRMPVHDFLEAVGVPDRDGDAPVVQLVVRKDGVELSATADPRDGYYPVIFVDGEDAGGNKLYVAEAELPNEDEPNRISARLYAGYARFESDEPVAKVSHRLLPASHVDAMEAFMQRRDPFRKAVWYNEDAAEPRRLSREAEDSTEHEDGFPSADEIERMALEAARKPSGPIELTYSQLVSSRSAQERLRLRIEGLLELDEIKAEPAYRAFKREIRRCLGRVAAPESTDMAAAMLLLFLAGSPDGRVVEYVRNLDPGGRAPLGPLS